MTFVRTLPTTIPTKSARQKESRGSSIVPERLFNLSRYPGRTRPPKPASRTDSPKRGRSNESQNCPSFCPYPPWESALKSEPLLTPPVGKACSFTGATSDFMYTDMQPAHRSTLGTLFSRDYVYIYTYPHRGIYTRFCIAVYGFWSRLHKHSSICDTLRLKQHPCFQRSRFERDKRGQHNRHTFVDEPTSPVFGSDIHDLLHLCIYLLRSAVIAPARLYQRDDKGVGEKANLSCWGEREDIDLILLSLLSLSL